MLDLLEYRHMIIMEQISLLSKWPESAQSWISNLETDVQQCRNELEEALSQVSVVGKDGIL